MSIDPKNIQVLQLPGVVLSQKKFLPKISSIYFVISNSKEIIYIGKAKNLYRRWGDHHLFERLKCQENITIAWLSVQNSDLLFEIETAMIKHFQPVFNKRQKHKNEPKPPIVVADGWSAEGLARLAEIVKQKRGDLTISQFSKLAGLSFGTVRDIETKQQPKLRTATLAALSPLVGLSVEELLSICTIRNTPSSPPCREFLTSDQVLPLIQQLPPNERRRLRDMDLETMSNKDFAAVMEATAAAVKRRLGI